MYQALYRKYRPQRFEDVVGQDAIIQTLKNAVVSQRVAHAYLFCGPRGTGKTTVAKIFAKMLNCEDPNLKPCEKCSNCQSFATGNHPDIIEIDAASNNGVDEVRNLIERVKYAPMLGTHKVYIIDEVHMMSTGAFNALLKTIEEPPAHVVFILATTEPHKVIPTIVSRCQRYDFNKVGLDDITRRLKTVCNQEKIDVEEEALRLIGQLSDGGMRDSLSILDQCVAYCTSRITVNDVRDIYGIVTTLELGEIFYDVYKGNVEGVISKLEEIEASGKDLKRFTQDLITLLKESLILDASRDTSLVKDANKEVIENYLSVANSMYRLRMLDELMDTYTKYPYASNILDYLETALLKSIIQEDSISDKAIHKSIEICDNSQKNSYDSLSDKSEICEKKPENSKNTLVLEDESISDVSRETFMKEETKDPKFILNDEYILQLLQGANKLSRQQDENRLIDVESYLSDLNYGKYASTLRKIQIMASGKNYLIVVTQSDIEAKQINALQMEKGYESFTKELLGVEKVVYAINQEEQKKILGLYRSLREANELPEPVFEVISIHRNKEKEKEQTSEQIMKEYFPNLKIIND